MPIFDGKDLSCSPLQRLCWYLPWLVLLMKSDDGSLTGSSGGKSIMDENEPRYGQSHIKPLKLHILSALFVCRLSSHFISLLKWLQRMFEQRPPAEMLWFHARDVIPHFLSLTITCRRWWRRRWWQVADFHDITAPVISGREGGNEWRQMGS